MFFRYFKKALMATEELPDVIQDIYAYSLESMKKHHEISEEKASNIALDIAEKTRERWGGIQIYIPKGTALDSQKRIENIKKDFNGSNHRDLAFKYKVSMQRIYTILKAVGRNEK